jgi:hypothetical protein
MVSTVIGAGVFAIVVMVSLPSLMRRRLRRHQVIVVALIAQCKAGVIALAVMASLPLMRRRLHRCCDGDCCSRLHCCRWCAGIFAIVAMAIVALVAMASLPQSS